MQAVDFGLRRMNQFWLVYGDDRTKAEVTSLLKVADNIGLVTAGIGVADSTENAVGLNDKAVHHFNFQSWVVKKNTVGLLHTVMLLRV